MANTNGGNSLFNDIINFFKNLFGTTEEQPSNNSQNNPSRSVPDSKPSTSTVTTNASNPYDQATGKKHVNEATFKYGSNKITVCKSNSYVAIKKKEDKNKVNERGAPKEEDPNKMGDYELIGPMPATFNDTEGTLDNLRAMPNVMVGTHVFHNADSGESVPMIPTEQIYIVFKEGSDLDECVKLLDAHFLEIVEKRGERELIVAITPQSKNPIKTTISLQKSPLVDIAEPEFISPPGLTAVRPADPLFKEQWHLENKGQHGSWPSSSFKRGADAKVVQAWEFLGNLGSSDVTVAVIDSGFDINHPDLKGDDGESKLVAPWDFETATDDPSPKLGDWHGTACAGVAIGAANGIGIVGAAPNAKFMPLRFSYISDSQIEKWFSYASKNGADIISNSWGSRDPNFVMSTRMMKAIHRCATEGRDGKGCIIVFAAGNTNRFISDTDDPEKIKGFGTHPDVITVAASNSKDERSSYSNYGHQISVAAPSNGSGGASVTTSDVTGTLVMPSGSVGFKGYSEGDYTSGFGGTSSACPLVAGICALLLSAKAGLTAKQVKAILEATSDKIGDELEYDENGHSMSFGYGRVNAYRAVKAAKEGRIPLSGTDVERPDAGGTNGTATQPTPPPIPAPEPDEIPAFNPFPQPEPEILTLPFEGLRGGALVRAGVEHIYKISLSQKLVFTLDSPLGEIGHDFDIFVKRGSAPKPDTSSYDERSAEKGSDEQLTIDQPILDDYYVLVRSFKGSGGYNLEACLESRSSNAAIETLPLKASTSGILVKDRVSQIVYKMGTSKTLSVEIDAPVGDNPNFDVYVKRNKIPKWNDYDGRGITQGSKEKIVINDPAPGDYYILIRAQSGSGGYNLRVSVE